MLQPSLAGSQTQGWVVTWLLITQLQSCKSRAQWLCKKAPYIVIYRNPLQGWLQFLAWLYTKCCITILHLGLPSLTIPSPEPFMSSPHPHLTGDSYQSPAMCDDHAGKPPLLAITKAYNCSFLLRKARLIRNSYSASAPLCNGCDYKAFMSLGRQLAVLIKDCTSNSCTAV